MSFFVIITICFLIVSGVNMFLSNKARQQGHDDNDGRFYYIVVGGAGLLYTLQNVIFMINGTF